jgi:hypothetical protein
MDRVNYRGTIGQHHAPNKVAVKSGLHRNRRIEWDLVEANRVAISAHSRGLQSTESAMENVFIAERWLNAVALI